MAKVLGLLGLAALACWLFALLTGAGFLVDERINWLKGEGGPGLECAYLGALGIRSRSYFYEPEPEKNTLKPPGLKSCPLWQGMAR